VQLVGFYYKQWLDSPVFEPWAG